MPSGSLAIHHVVLCNEVAWRQETQSFVLVGFRAGGGFECVGGVRALGFWSLGGCSKSLVEHLVNPLSAQVGIPTRSLVGNRDFKRKLGNPMESKPYFVGQACPASASEDGSLCERISCV